MQNLSLLGDLGAGIVATDLYLVANIHSDSPGYPEGKVVSLINVACSLVARGNSNAIHLSIAVTCKMECECL